MADNVIILVTFVASVLALVSCAMTVSLLSLYFNMKKELNDEIQHLKEERNACRLLLKGANTRDGS